MKLAADAKNIRIRCVVDSQSTVMGDAQRLHQVMANLLSNAVKFTPKGGHVDVSAQRDQSSIEVTVADSGRGIDPAFLPRVFERFKQEETGASRRGGGLGLGLSIVKHIVERHGGLVRADSPGVNQGATFTVRLPIVVATRRTVAAPPKPRVPATFDCPPELAGARILVVEDEADSRELLNAFLLECPAIVEPASTAVEGLAKVKSFRPRVIISDVGLAEHDGLWFIARVRELPEAEGGRTPAIALTAYARPDDRARILLSGFQSYIAKPADPMEVMATIASLMSVRGDNG
jgi:CheY-like chemotaxis protein/anti-sigma regulatory factor (Ser/Thr protein kinase)